MKIRGTPHLEQALEEGRLKLTFDVPKRNPLTHPESRCRISVLVRIRRDDNSHYRIDLTVHLKMPTMHTAMPTKSVGP